MKPAILLRRIDEIEAKSGERSLTGEELDEYGRLLKQRTLRRHRLPYQIRNCEQKLARLHAELAAMS
ncbi:hypothetical protein SAMN02927924_01350 [Sphingobium faniae]|nr:hypothetical protein SAMN02927924_01350 [Sphingobium faniae]